MPYAMEYDADFCLNVHADLRERYKDRYINTFRSVWREGFKLEKTNEDINPIIQSINITLNNLFASFSLQEYQKYLLEDTEEKDRDYFWYVYHIERVVSDISTLIDLKLTLANRVKDLKYNERLIRSDFNNKLRKDDPLHPVIFNNKFKTKEIRNDFTHGIKPYLYTDVITENNGIYAFGKGKRNYNFLKDHWKIEYDFLLILDKLDQFIDILELERLYKEEGT